MNTLGNESAFWMPFTNNRAFRTDPRLLASAKGMFYYTPDGREVLDATSGLWCVNAGHAQPKIVEAIQKQAATLDFAPAFHLGHPLIFEFAQALTTTFPAGMDRIFFTNSGSEAVDTALKMALAYQRAIGQGTRTRLIGRERGYHGVGFGGLSVGGMINNRRGFLHLPGVDHLPHTLNRDKAAFTRGQPEWGAHLADALEDLVALHGAETIAAVIVEPVAGSTGVIVPPKGYLERLREITSRHGILLIFDEVITAFGRLGAPTASQYFNVTPDIMTCAKGITNASVPMGAAVASRKVHDAIVESAAPGIEFYHGYTYSGHPLAAAAGLATLSVYREEGLFQRSANLAPSFEASAHALRGTRHVIDIRNLGLMAAIELEPRDKAPGARAMEAFRRAFDAGLLLRITGDTIALSPPLIVEEAQIGRMFGQLGDILQGIA
jgi:beta-alanine--pyruvate transaminase